MMESSSLQRMSCCPSKKGESTYRSSAPMLPASQHRQAENVENMRCSVLWSAPAPALALERFQVRVTVFLADPQEGSQPLWALSLALQAGPLWARRYLLTILSIARLPRGLPRRRHDRSAPRQMIFNFFGRSVPKTEPA